MDKQLSGDWQGKMIGRYQLMQLLGRGALSEVWLANDTQLRRQVALKILPAALAHHRTYLLDFSYEARAAASLEHPHILGVHDFGEHEIEPGEIVPYVVMPYVPGGTLRERLRAVQGLLPIQESLRYLQQAAQAIDFAHSKQVLHRDIKPANMLLRDSWLLLADFGLAKVLDGNFARGQTYAGAGTPEYMAPEQIMGQAQVASDRYSLAVVAYQLFTGHQPFHGATPAETATQQLQAPLPLPRQLNPHIPPEVERILVMALARRIELRPPSCMVLVDALQHAWMSSAQSDVDPDATLLAPWSRRLLSGASSPAQPPLSVSSPSMPVLSSHDESGQATPQVGISSPNQITPQPGGVFAPPPPVHHVTDATSLAYRTVTDVGRTLYPAVGPTPSHPSAMAPSQPPLPLEKKVGRRAILIGGAVAAALVIGGGAYALAALHNPVAPVHLLHAPTPTPVPPGPRQLIAGTHVLTLTGHTDEVWVASWDPSGHYLMTAGKDGLIMLWNIAAALEKSAASTTLATPQRKWTVAGISFRDLTDAVCWSPDGQQLVAADDFTANVYVLDAFGGNNQPTIYNDVDTTTTGDSAVYTSVFPGPLKDQFTVLNGKQAQVWRVGQTDKPEVNYDNGVSSDDLGKANWSFDGSMLAAVNSVLSTSRQLLLWKSTDRVHPQAFNFPKRPTDFTFFALADTVAWSPVDAHLLLTSDGDVAVLWDVRQEKPVLTLGANAHASTPVISQMCWSPNGRYVAGSYTVLGADAENALTPQILIWDVQTLLRTNFPAAISLPALTFPTQHTQSLLDLSWSPDGRYLATSSLDKTVMIWRVDGDKA